MAGSVSLHLIDLAVFALYMVVAVGLGLWVARKGKDTAQSYFLGNKTIPWFVVGSSMVAADISSEQFISNVSGAYKYGIVLAAGDWNAWIIYSLLLFIFLPYYVRTGIYTMPEFLERRYNATCRYIFAVVSIFGFVTAINAGALYSGGLMLDSFFGDDLSRHAQHSFVGPTNLPGDLVHRFFRCDHRHLHYLWRPSLGRMDRFSANHHSPFCRVPCSGPGTAARRELDCVHQRTSRTFSNVQTADPQAISIHGRFHGLPFRGHLVQLHQPAHGSARSKRQG